MTAFTLLGAAPIPWYAGSSSACCTCLVQAGAQGSYSSVLWSTNLMRPFSTHIEGILPGPLLVVLRVRGHLMHLLWQRSSTSLYLKGGPPFGNLATSRPTYFRPGGAFGASLTWVLLDMLWGDIIPSNSHYSPANYYNLISAKRVRKSKLLNLCNLKIIIKLFKWTCCARGV